MKAGIRYFQAAPHFLVDNVRAAADFYQRVLGFVVDYIDGDPPTYAIMVRHEVWLHLSLKGSLGFPIGPGSVFVSVTGIKDLWSHATAEGINVIEPLKERDLGHGFHLQTFTMRDPDSNILRFGQRLPPKHVVKKTER